MADRAHTGPKDGEPETLPGEANPIDPSDLEEDIDEHGSIDKLIAETDQGWDIDEQVLTLQQAAAAKSSSETEPESPPVTPERPPGGFSRPPKGPPPLPRDGSPARSTRPRPKAPPPLPGSRSAEHISVRPPSEMSHPDAIVDLLTARVALLESADDRVGLARAHIELAIASEIILGDDTRATAQAEAALRVDPASPAAHAFLRRKKHARSALPEMLVHVEHELSAATSEPHQVELLAEKARLLEAIGGHGPALRATWERALAHAPRHAAALKGLESELVARALASGAAQDWEALAVHLARMADAYATDPGLAAWLHVERAQVLEKRLGRIDAARGGLERAVELDPSVGPVRDSLVRHVAAHEDWGALVRLLDEEARIETSPARCARLELDAAMIASARMGEHGQACALLERAAARAPTTHGVDRRVLDELVRLHEVEGGWTDAARARRARLRFVTDPAAIAYELRALAAVAEKAGEPENAIADVQRALALEGTDPTLVDTLDRLLAATGKHEQRIATWLQEAARTEDTPRRGRSFARAAQICEEIGRHEDAVRHLRSAWVATPGDPELLDALARLLAPTLPEPAESSARSLVELYVQAADRAPENGRKMAYLEKAALLWEELLGDPARAARAYELVLTIDPDRRSAILGLERTSARSGNGRLRSRALLDEARMATDRQAQLSLRTRAAAALAKHDPSRAARLVHDVLEADPAHAEARALETRLEEDAGRWDRAARSLRARIDHVSSSAEKVALWLALAAMQQTRLHLPLDALRSLEEARTLDPAHAVPAEEIARLLEDHGDARTLRDAIERLAANAQTPEERARHLARAAEIDELRLNEDANAVRTYQRALAEAPDDALVAERLTRVV
ncbi:MAG TPA: hypothetical protein VKU41_10835, partial [Polyangiaceae bacterium]|nr:hypothetical protein [Polyangiaceae bacterium]